MVRDAVPHALGLSSGEYVVEPGGLRATVVLARNETNALRDGAVGLRDALAVEGPRGPCAGQVLEAVATEEDGVLVRLAYACGAGERPTRARLDLAARLGPAHRHVARVVEGEGRRPRDVVVSEPTELLGTEGAASSSPTPGPPRNAAAREGTDARPSFELVGLGARHVLTGWDHVAFLLGLVLPRVSLRALGLTVTAFTVGHTAALGLVAAGALRPSPRIVEPLVALSLAWVGVEVLRGQRPGARVAAPFGLVHGLAFAEALAEVSPPGAAEGAALALRVVSFNAGVEVGQLAALLPLVLGSFGLVRLGARGDVVRRALAAALVIAGLLTALVRATAG